MMLRSLCGCRTNKVDDKDVVIVKDYRDTVFIYASNKILARSLIGALFKTLENRNLKPTGMNMVKSTKELVQKSGILKKTGKSSAYVDEVCIVSLWHGENIFAQTVSAISSFCRNYAFLQGIDVIITDSTKSTRKEAELWINSASPTLLTIPAATAEEPPADGDDPPPNLEEETTTVIEAAEEHERPGSPSLHHVQDPDDVVLIRESSTADTLPVDEKVENPHVSLVTPPPNPPS
ncbi:hypothetical protein RB195_004292 [Necator americanus]